VAGEGGERRDLGSQLRVGRIAELEHGGPAVGLGDGEHVVEREVGERWEDRQRPPFRDLGDGRRKLIDPGPPGVAAHRDHSLGEPPVNLV
jgi:hypothetical protein